MLSFFCFILSFNCRNELSPFDHISFISQFITNKEDPDSKNEDDPLLKLKSMQKGLVKCRICKEDHWTTQCPYKDTLLPVQEALNKVNLIKFVHSYSS